MYVSMASRGQYYSSRLPFKGSNAPGLSLTRVIATILLAAVIAVAAQANDALPFKKIGKERLCLVKSAHLAEDDGTFVKRIEGGGMIIAVGSGEHLEALPNQDVGLIQPLSHRAERDVLEHRLLKELGLGKLIRQPDHGPQPRTIARRFHVGRP